MLCNSAPFSEGSLSRNCVASGPTAGGTGLLLILRARSRFEIEFPRLNGARCERGYFGHMPALFWNVCAVIRGVSLLCVCAFPRCWVSPSKNTQEFWFTIKFIVKFYEKVIFYLWPVFFLYNTLSFRFLFDLQAISSERRQRSSTIFRKLASKLSSCRGTIPDRTSLTSPSMFSREVANWEIAPFRRSWFGSTLICSSKSSGLHCFDTVQMLAWDLHNATSASSLNSQIQENVDRLSAVSLWAFKS